MARLTSGLYQLIGVFLLVCMVVPLAAAADSWTKKPYQNWSAEETRHMLEESPWTATVTVGGVQTNVSGNSVPTAGATSFGSDRQYTGSVGAEMEANPQITYTLQLRSALPIREAEVRSSQIGSHYDAMSPEKKAAFDANAAKFLAVSFQDRVVVSVTFHTDNQDYRSLLRNYWASQTLAKLGTSPQAVFLNANTERLSLISYTFKDDTFQFVFPRPKQVQPNEKIGVEFVHPRINVIPQQRILQEFSLKKMLVNGEPSF